jgi:hypothetical protein
MQHIKILNLRLAQIQPFLRHTNRARVDRADGQHLAATDGILAFHPDVRATRATEVPVHGFDTRSVVAEFRARGRGVQSEVGGGRELQVRCAEGLTEGAVAAGGGEVTLGGERDVGGVFYEAGCGLADWKGVLVLYAGSACR